MSNEELIKRLLDIETWADGLREECRKTRKLIQAEVSTSTTNQGALTEEEEEKIISKRRKQMIKPKLKIA